MSPAEATEIPARSSFVAPLSLKPLMPVRLASGRKDGNCAIAVPGSEVCRFEGCHANNISIAQYIPSAAILSICARAERSAGASGFDGLRRVVEEPIQVVVCPEHPRSATGQKPKNSP